jgi:murein DD-endopeptidase MepM/ murein hydrolase activator NlpD
MSRAAEALAALPSRWPVRGRVNSEFGPRASPWGGEKRGEFHSGIDIGARIGTPVKAPARGTVLFAGRVPEYGISLVIDHGNDIKSLYGHLSRLLVTQSQRVERGQTVALTGNTGRSSGPHLHYEILVLGRAVNPRTYLWH